MTFKITINQVLHKTSIFKLKDLKNYILLNFLVARNERKSLSSHIVWVDDIGQVKIGNLNLNFTLMNCGSLKLPSFNKLL